MADQTNGGSGQLPDGFSQLVLTLKRADFTLQIGGVTQNYDEALSMLQMAVRGFEARLRAGKAAELLNTQGRMHVHFDPRGPRRA